MTNAQEKKREWKKKLTDMDLTTLLDYRDSLMAQGVLYNIISEESAQNSQATASEVSMVYPLSIVLHYPLSIVLHYPLSIVLHCPLSIVLHYPLSIVLHYPLSIVLHCPLSINSTALYYVCVF